MQVDGMVLWKIREEEIVEARERERAWRGTPGQG